ncbi:MAG TPA: hypothetical protein PK490_15385 [Prosthecobacter sp.]|nr:hypothetical protein [Prosthecobacter sp.]HRK15663.1 hypothetical protein [Prosthecobacter sp.]
MGKLFPTLRTLQHTGHLVQVRRSTNARGVTTTRTFDLAGRLTVISYDDDSTPAFFYQLDHRDRATAVFNGNDDSEGALYAYTYNGPGGVWDQMFWEGGSVTRTFDDHARLHQLMVKQGEDVLFTTTHSHDPATGGLASVTHGGVTAMYDWTAPIGGLPGAVRFRRWSSDLFNRDYKSTTHMEVMRTKTSAMIEKEPLMHAIAYNALRALILESATVHQQELGRTRFASQQRHGGPAPAMACPSRRLS